MRAPMALKDLYNLQAAAGRVRRYENIAAAYEGRMRELGELPWGRLLEGGKGGFARRDE